MTGILAVDPQRIGGKASAGLRGQVTEKACRRRGHAIVAAGVELDQKRGLAVWGSTYPEKLSVWD